jgi:hypothetical protein
MAIYVFDTSSGALDSYCPNDADPVGPADHLAAKGLAVLTGQLPRDATHDWDPGTRSVVTVTAPEVPRWIPAYDFVLAFTAIEYAAIKASGDATIQHFLFALSLAQQVDMNSATIRQGVGYCVSIGLLTQDRATAILVAGGG